MYHAARALALVFFAAVAGLSPTPYPTGSVDCTTIAPDLVTFRIDDPAGFPAWSDGDVLATFRPAHRGLVLTTDRLVQGVIVVGPRFMRIDRHESRHYTLRLPGGITYVDVCYRPEG